MTHPDPVAHLGHNEDLNFNVEKARGKDEATECHANKQI